MEVCALSALCAVCVEVCALSALCAICVGFVGVDAGFRLLCFGPETCGASSAGRGFAVNDAKFQQLFEGEVDALFAYVAMKETPDFDSGLVLRGDVEGLADALGGGIDGRGVEEEAGTGSTVVPYGQGGLEMADFDGGAAIQGGVDGTEAQNLSFGTAGGGTVCVRAALA